ncbi:HlyD family efflux transporter periplasmic adaptor subunit [Neolewinella persica]|uniref:HlyD family efflux transporter periplasmic adaptor subunit n=1 Tax=Neolewinella persica TaxID=70998 RepID=UPI0003A70B9D|nr:HlyD family efflux transporter periplasmic adaptor subunit [Neolewinella persica]
MRFNLFYPMVLLLGLSLVFLFRPPTDEDLNFFGFAESNETTVNYNYPVVIDQLLVRPGQSVKEGEALLKVSRRKAKETLTDQTFRIAELRAEENLWRQRKQSEMQETAWKSSDDLSRINEDIISLRKELAYKKSLAAGLESITVTAADYQPIEDKITTLELEKARKQEAAQLKRESLRQELNLGKNPYAEQILRLEAEMEFEEEQKVQPFIVKAPSDGIVGNIDVREAEHVQSYATLLSFYEPHSSIVRGYVHEDQTAKVAFGDLLQVYSLKTEGRTYAGQVVGLGSRIVEIPNRLRKLPDFKTYGREVIVEISPENLFLQKEKVGIRREPTER